MQIVSERCAGLDIGKDEVVACVRTPAAAGKGRSSELRVFRTFTSGLEELAGWLTTNGVVEVVMEATGQYWKPVWYVLEDRGFDLRLVNAKHVKMVPGRKPTSPTQHGSPSYSNTGYSGRRSCHRLRSGSYAI